MKLGMGEYSGICFTKYNNSIRKNTENIFEMLALLEMLFQIFKYL